MSNIDKIIASLRVYVDASEGLKESLKKELKTVTRQRDEAVILLKAAKVWIPDDLTEKHRKIDEFLDELKEVSDD